MIMNRFGETWPSSARQSAKFEPGKANPSGPFLYSVCCGDGGFFRDISRCT
jgi:hypothetical protein